MEKELKLLDNHASMIDVCKMKHRYWWAAKDKFDALVENRPYLQEMTIQITDRCNLSCEKCNKRSFENRDMPFDKVIEIINQGKALGLRHIHFTGGEPTLYPEFHEVVRHCVSKGIRVDMSTNGYFNEDVMKKIVDAGINSINVSWDDIWKKPPCIDFVFDYDRDIFLNHMVMPSSYFKLVDFLIYVMQYPKIVDVQLMPPRGDAEKFTKSQINAFNVCVSPRVFEISKHRFPMVQRKILYLLDDGATEGIYHRPIDWTCHRSKMELRVGNKGYSTCTYLYRDGLQMCSLDKSVEEAFEICKRKCAKKGKPTEMCDQSCSPEVAYFNYNVEKAINV